MGGTKGYRSYRGRTSKGKIALAVLLVLIILAAVGFLWLQEYIVSTIGSGSPPGAAMEDGDPPRKEEVPPRDERLPFRSRRSRRLWLRLCPSAAPLTQAGWKDAWLGASVMSAPAYNAAAVTLKDSTGHIYFEAATARGQATIQSTAEDTRGAPRP